jgi:hypothetical protein
VSTVCHVLLCQGGVLGIKDVIMMLIHDLIFGGRRAKFSKFGKKLKT